MRTVERVDYGTWMNVDREPNWEPASMPTPAKLTLQVGVDTPCLSFELANVVGFLLLFDLILIIMYECIRRRR